MANCKCQNGNTLCWSRHIQLMLSADELSRWLFHALSLPMSTRPVDEKEPTGKSCVMGRQHPCQHDGHGSPRLLCSLAPDCWGRRAHQHLIQPGRQIRLCQFQQRRRPDSRPRAGRVSPVRRQTTGLPHPRGLCVQVDQGELRTCPGHREQKQGRSRSPGRQLHPVAQGRRAVSLPRVRQGAMGTGQVFHHQERLPAGALPESGDGQMVYSQTARWPSQPRFPGNPKQSTLRLPLMAPLTTLSPSVIQHSVFRILGQRVRRVFRLGENDERNRHGGRRRRWLYQRTRRHPAAYPLTLADEEQDSLADVVRIGLVDQHYQ